MKYINEERKINLEMPETEKNIVIMCDFIKAFDKSKIKGENLPPNDLVVNMTDSVKKRILELAETGISDYEIYKTIREEYPVNVSRYRIRCFLATHKDKLDPGNTNYFLNWVKENKIKKFGLAKFLNDAPDSMTTKKAEEIISQQIGLRNIYQLDTKNFKVPDKVIKRFVGDYYL